MRRVDGAIKEVVSSHIAEDLGDPRIGFVTVTAAKTSTDLHYASVYVTVLGDEDARSAALAGLESSRGYLQSKLAAELRMKHTPSLTFIYDDSTDHGMHISGLISDIERDSGAGHSKQEENA